MICGHSIAIRNGVCLMYLTCSYNNLTIKVTIANAKYELNFREIDAEQ